MGSGMILDGRRELVPGLDITNWLDDPVLRLRKGEDFRTRPPDAWIRAVVIHTTKGLMSGAPLAGFGPPVDAGQRVARYWSRDSRNAGAHFVIDHDGKVFQTCDVIREAAYGCPRWNEGGVHIELYQGPQGQLFEGALGVCVLLVDALTLRLAIQRFIPHRYVGPVRRLVDGDPRATGVFGHRDLATNRGSGDPGSAIFNRLGLAGYETLNYEFGEDLEIVRRRQRELGITADGVAGPRTAAALRAAGYPAGLFVSRPGDPPAAPPSPSAA